jgi:hypothetical protein
MGDIESTLDDVISRTKDAAEEVILEAGQQAMQVIASLKGAYIDCLNKTLAGVDKEIQNTMTNVSDLVTVIKAQADDILQQTASKVQTIIAMSPLSRYWVPLLGSTSPSFFAVGGSDTTSVMVTYNGNFYYAPDRGCTPSLKINNKTFAPVTITTQKLEFLVNISKDDPNLKAGNYSYLKAELSVPWKYGYMPWSWTTSTYRTLLGALPTTPGKLMVNYETPATTISNHISCPKHIDGGLVSIGNGVCTADPGYRIDPTSVRVAWPKGQGDYTCKITEISATQIAYFYNGLMGGGADFSIEYNELEDLPAKPRTEDRSSLRWGDSFIATPQAGEKITGLVFDAFTGQHVEFQPRSDHSNKFIQLDAYDDTLKVSAANPATLENVGPAMRKAEPMDLKRDT